MSERNIFEQSSKRQIPDFHLEDFVQLRIYEIGIVNNLDEDLQRIK